MDNESKAAEESRRDRHWDPAVRWRVLQETVQWAESQATVRRNTKAARLEEQQQKLGRADEIECLSTQRPSPPD
ncbi:MAG: hypothetical protein J5I93_19980 [Pirellulaceae bacterium]|nr:hypothetical protein [Pirellulaceae bacterium]